MQLVKFSVQIKNYHCVRTSTTCPAASSESTPAALTTTSTRALNLLVGSKNKNYTHSLSRPPAPPLSLRRAKSNILLMPVRGTYSINASAAVCMRCPPCVTMSLCVSHTHTHTCVCALLSRPGGAIQRTRGASFKFFVYFLSIALSALSSYSNNAHNCATQKCLLEWVHHHSSHLLLV
jgi:hypothetical protein